MTKENEVLNFIQKRFSENDNWLNGNCYYFAVILKTRFPSATIWYDIINGHFFVNINGQDYDWQGILQRKDNFIYIEWDKMNEYDLNVYQRIIRDCIM